MARSVLSEVATILDGNGDVDFDAMVATMNADQVQRYCDELNADLPKGVSRITPATLNRKYVTTSEVGQHIDLSERTRYAKPGQVCGKGRVRALSDKQIAFIKALMAQRDTTNLVRLPGSEDIENMSLRGASDLIDRLLKCPVKPGMPTERMATEKQISFALSLTERKMGAAKRAEVEATAKAMTMKDISAVIDKLKGMADYVESTPAVNVATTKEEIKTVAGIYELNGKIYRMKKARTGNHFYAQELTNVETGAWEYAEGMARKVPSEGRKLTKEEAEELSSALGSCCCCGRTLTATVDGVGPAARYIGPICEAKYF